MCKVNIIGSGFASLSASCYLADAGFEVNLFEKNASIGGRARKMVKKVLPLIWAQVSIGCLTFLINFLDFGKKTSDFYELKRLTPAIVLFSKMAHQ